MVHQIEMMGTRQWLGLMAGSAIAPVSERIAAAFPRQLASPAHAAARAREVVGALPAALPVPSSLN